MDCRLRPHVGQGTIAASEVASLSQAHAVPDYRTKPIGPGRLSLLSRMSADHYDLIESRETETM
jgi:hypothetical protein